MKRTLAAVGATAMGLTGAVAGSAVPAQAATPLPACTTVNESSFDYDQTDNEFYGTCIPQYGLGKAEFTITDPAGFPAGFKPLTDTAVTATPSIDPGAADAYFGSSTANGFIGLTASNTTPTEQTYSGSLVYRLAGVEPIATTALPAGCYPDEDTTFTNAFEVSYLPTTVTFTQTVDGAPVTFTVVSTPPPLFLGYSYITGDPDAHDVLCASNGTDTIVGPRGSTEELYAYQGVYINGFSGRSVLTPFTSLPNNLTGQLGTFAATPNAPTLTAVTPGDGAATVEFTPASDPGGTVTGYEYSLDGGLTWLSLTTSPAGASLTATITGLTNGTTYPVTIRAISATAASPASNSIDVTPRVSPAPGTPSVPASLAATGFDPSLGALGGALVLAAGLVLSLSRRRRRA